jgi:hypothetical protein
VNADAQRNLQLLREETNAVLVTTQHNPAIGRPIRFIHAAGPLELRTRAAQKPDDDAEIVVIHAALLRPLICPMNAYAADVRHTHCHDCPVPGGVQIQPDTDNWVGTLACLVRTGDPTDPKSYAALTNWHVASVTDKRPRVEIHQPTRSRTPIATCTRFAQPTPGETNYCDASAGSCLVNRRHTLSPQILNIGPIHPEPINLATGMNVQKSGRTTGHTTGWCESTGAAARVSYGNYTVEFADQDVLRGDNGDLSAAGDSGSLVLTRDGAQPASLLFAGGGGITIASPMRYVTEALGLKWPVIP